MRRTGLICALSALLGCGADGSGGAAGSGVSTAPGDTAPADAAPGDAPLPSAGSDTTSPADTWLSAPPAGPGRGTAAPRVAILDTLRFTRELEPGVALGFDLDGTVSAGGDPATCGKTDFVSPDGTPGIDNQLALLTPLFDFVGIGAVEGLIQGAIEEGGLLLGFRIEGLTDPGADADVTVTLLVAQGTPLLGTDGQLLSGQTFRLADDSPDLAAPTARVEGGVLTAGPFDAVLPIVVFGKRYELPFYQAQIRATLTYDGGLSDGVFGGEVRIADLLALAALANQGDDNILPAVTTVLEDIGDLAPDPAGVCRSMSAALGFTAVSAFLFESPR